MFAASPGDNDTITPTAFHRAIRHLAHAVVAADNAETAGKVQCQTRLVLREDPTLNQPEACSFRLVQKAGEQVSPNPEATSRFGDIDAVLNHATVNWTGRKRATGRPARNLPIDFRY